MEDEQDTQSANNSPEMVAAPPPEHTVTLALPIQKPPPKRIPVAGGGGGREDCWSEGATETLIAAWGERYVELSRGNLKQKHWQEVADAVSSRDHYTKPPKTDVQCKNRIDTLKKKYKLEKSKILSGAGEPSKWVFFHKLDQLIGPSVKNNIIGGPSQPSASKFPIHQFRPPPLLDSVSLDSASRDSTDSLPPETVNGKRRRNSKNGVRGAANSLRDLTRAILKFGELYERAESSKLEQVIELEKRRMGFTRELELQRMQFFMKTQLELSQLKHEGWE
ncbi:trihelix transcription factor ASIL2-like [Tasmannia lanceolata]|uniref:trihelix transcription factor ASIL2-like n=1 Tax=Tasmannia lanceolata TaxID=3420 RepID=UPI00406289C2